MKILICGSRDYPNLCEVDTLIEKMPKDWEVITGGAGGVDQRAESEAKRRGIKVTVIKPDLKKVKNYWESVGRYYARNMRMVDLADGVIAFRTKGKKGGTTQTIEYALKAGKKVKIYESKGVN